MKLDDQDNELMKGQLVAVMAAGRRAHAAVDLVDALISSRLGLNRSDLRCLNLLENGPLRATDLAARLSLTSGAVTALLDRLEAQGFVERHRSSADRRVVDVSIPQAAFGRLAALYGRIGAEVASAFDGRDEAALTTDAEALERFADALEAGVAALEADR
jgi:DNA-binding MarR family transcriptional regulator